MCGLGLLAVLRQDVVAARQQYASLQHVRGTTLQVGVVAIDRMLGLLAHTMGDLDQAMTHFEDALAFCRKAGYRPELAWTCCDYADTLLQRNEPGDRDKAVSLLDESLSISTELGMRPLMDRVAAIQEQIRLQPESAPGVTDFLVAPTLAFGLMALPHLQEVRQSESRGNRNPATGSPPWSLPGFSRKSWRRRSYEHANRSTNRWRGCCLLILLPAYQQTGRCLN